MNDSTSLITDTIIRTVGLGLMITGAAIDERHTFDQLPPGPGGCHLSVVRWDGRFCVLFRQETSR